MSVSRYVRKGQHTYHGMTVEQVRKRAAYERRQAYHYRHGNAGDQEIAAEHWDRAAWLDAVAERMEMKP